MCGKLRLGIRKIADIIRPNSYALKKYLIRDGKKHPIAIICPGGGYNRVCSYVEGLPFTKALNRMGVSAVVVYYRVRERAGFPAPQDDLARAVRQVLANAEAWNLDAAHYSVWGSSAGGHLVGTFGCENIGYRKYGLPKPDTLVLIYPVITMGAYSHRVTRERLLGLSPDQAVVEQTSVEMQVTPDYPRTFLWCGSADRDVSPENSRMLDKRLTENQVPHRFMEYPNVGHGVGLGSGSPCDGWIDEAVRYWLGEETVCRE